MTMKVKFFEVTMLNGHICSGVLTNANAIAYEKQSTLISTSTDTKYIGWEINGLKILDIVMGANAVVYIVGKDDDYPTMVEFNLVMTIKYDYWTPKSLYPSDEMILLHKAIWEV